jgi:hypothetical protein
MTFHGSMVQSSAVLSSPLKMKALFSLSVLVTVLSVDVVQHHTEDMNLCNIHVT